MSNANAQGKKKKTGWIKWVVIILVVAVAAFIIISAASSAKMMSSMVFTEPVALSRKTIENKISVSGTVESQTFTKVSSKLSYVVDSINVEVGDKVKAGDILAVLNSDDLQDQILQQQANLDSSNVNIEYSLSDAEKRYNEAREQINNGTYPEIRNAKLTLDNAEENLRKAKEKYQEQLDIQGSDRDSQLKSAQKGVESAKYELDCAKADYDQVKKDVENEDYSDIRQLKKQYDDLKKEYDTRYSDKKAKELQDAREAYETALSNYTYMTSMMSLDPQNVSQANITVLQQEVTDTKAKLTELEKKYDVKTAKDNYDEIVKEYTKAKADIDSANDVKLKNAKRSYERAKTSYENAQNTLNSVKEGNNTSIKNYKDAVDDAQTAVDDYRETYNLALKNAESSLASLKSAADREKVLSGNDAQVISLEILKGKLDDCVVVAPCDGTITAVNAVEGSPAQGVLFIIEDLDNLKMTALVKEYSISKLSKDLPVKVTIPSMNNKEFDGVISKIDPTGFKDATGKSDGTTGYQIEVNIRDTKDSGVLIGMTSKCTAVTGSAENVYAVSYDSIVEDGDGNCYVFTDEPIPNGNGSATAKRISVKTGFESDAEIEIISDELTEGMDILSNASELTDGGMIIINSALGEAIQNAGNK